MQPAGGSIRAFFKPASKAAGAKRASGGAAAASTEAGTGGDALAATTEPVAAAADPPPPPAVFARKRRRCVVAALALASSVQLAGNRNSLDCSILPHFSTQAKRPQLHGRCSRACPCSGGSTTCRRPSCCCWPIRGSSSACSSGSHRCVCSGCSPPPPADTDVSGCGPAALPLVPLPNLRHDVRPRHGRRCGGGVFVVMLASTCCGCLCGSVHECIPTHVHYRSCRQLPLPTQLPCALHPMLHATASPKASRPLQMSGCMRHSTPLPPRARATRAGQGSGWCSWTAARAACYCLAAPTRAAHARCGCG